MTCKTTMQNFGIYESRLFNQSIFERNYLDFSDIRVPISESKSDTITWEKIKLKVKNIPNFEITEYRLGSVRNRKS